MEKTSARELFDYVVNEGRKDYTVQRYKGLGEMDAEQLFETTMNPAQRVLVQVRVNDAEKADAIFNSEFEAVRKSDIDFLSQFASKFFV